MEENKIEKSSTITLTTIMFLLCALWLNGGFIKIPYFNAAVFLALASGGVFFSFFEITKMQRKIWAISGIIYGFIFFIILVPTSIGMYDTIESSVMRVLYAVILLYIQIYLKQKNAKIQKFFIFAIILDCIIINIRTMFILSDPDYTMISRIFARGAEAVAEEGVSVYLLGGFGYIYALVFALIYLFIRKDQIGNFQRSERIVLYTFVYTSIATIILAQYTISILILALGLIFTSLTRNGVSPQSIISSILIFVIGLIISVPILEFLVENEVFGDMITDRLSTLIDVSNNTNTGNDSLGDRIKLYTLTLSRVPDFFLGGLYGKYKQIYGIIGGHTEWLDNFVRYGVIRYAFYITFLIKAIRISLPKLKIKSRYFSIILCIIVLGCINPMTFNNFYLVMFIFIPFVFYNDTEFLDSDIDIKEKFI